MSNKAVNSSKAPAAVGPYSHSVLAGNTLYVSGQLGLDPVTGDMADGVEAQAEQAFKNLQAILAESNMSTSDVVKTTVFLKSMADFVKVNEIYGKYFTDLLPARSCVAVAALPKDGLFEIEVVAVKN